jgi:cytochrome c553
MTTRQKHILYNVLFLLVCAGILLFLLLAPPETTKPLPNDQDHQMFLTMKKKEAERRCESCHGPDGRAALPETHPPKYRCLFCHKLP